MPDESTNEGTAETAATAELKNKVKLEQVLTDKEWDEGLDDDEVDVGTGEDPED